MISKKNSICLPNCQFILFSSFPLAGKDAACEVGAVPILSQLLTEKSTEVKSGAAAALMAYVSFLLFNVKSFIVKLFIYCI